MRNAKLTPHEERAVGVRAGTDPRTVRRYLRGEPMRSTTSARIADALRELDNDTGAIGDGGLAARAGARIGD
jgi:hypothetical protein